MHKPLVFSSSEICVSKWNSKVILKMSKLRRKLRPLRAFIEIRIDTLYQNFFCIVKKQNKLVYKIIMFDEMEK